MVEEAKVVDFSKFADLPIWPVPKDEKHEKRLRECVLAEFMNVQEPGVMASCLYGNTKKNKTFKFVHGGRYRVPRFLKEHMERLGETKWKWAPDGTGATRAEKAGISPRFQFREVFE